MKKYILLLLFIVSCNVPERKIKGYKNYYDIQSVRVDDDGEYHIVAVARDGSVKTLHDVSDGSSIYLNFGNYKKAQLVDTINDACCGEGEYSYADYGSVYLPFDYKIQTFDD